MRPTINPVLEREIQVRMRSWRAVVGLMLYLLLVGLVAYVAYEAERSFNSDPFGSISATETAGIGRSIFEWTLLLLLILIHFSLPAIVSGAIAGERERQTLVPLQVTLLSPGSIVAGKLGASVAFVSLLVVATLPVLAIGFLIGGVAMGDVMRAVLAVLSTTLVLGAVSICCSAVARRVQVATVAAYGIVLVMTLGSFAAYGAAEVINEQWGFYTGDPPEELLYLAPVVAVSDLLDDTRARRSPFEALASLTNREEDPSPYWPYWLRSGVVLGAVTVAALWWTTRRITTPAEVER